jgi:Fe-S-cluster containining protein
MCEKCVALCKSAGPRLPTPAEAEVLIERGYGHQLGVFKVDGVDVITPKVKWDTKFCTFFRRGKCVIHDVCKPLQCRVAMGCLEAKPARDDYPTNEFMAQMWDSARGRMAIERLQRC